MHFLLKFDDQECLDGIQLYSSGDEGVWHTQTESDTIMTIAVQRGKK